MQTTTIPPLTYRAQALDHMGLLRTSCDALHDRAELNRRMDRDGYLFLPGLLDRHCAPGTGGRPPSLAAPQGRCRARCRH